MASAPKPITPLKGVRCLTTKPKQSAIDWFFWKNLRDVQLWQAAFLACNIDPDSKNYDHIESYGISEENVSKLLRLLKSNFYLKQFFSPNTLNIGDSNLCKVRLSEFAAWCLYIGLDDIPPELAELAKALQQTKAISENHTVSNTNPNEIEISQLLNAPARQDAWFDVIADMTTAFYAEFGKLPKEAQSWGRLWTSPPAGYVITTGTDKGEDCLSMPGEKPLSKSAFSKRWESYTANKAQ